MELVTHINTSQGIIECKLKRINWYGADLVNADLWRGEMFLESRITLFRSSACFQWDGQRYKMIRRRPWDYTNDYWLELEDMISNTIIVNE
jgi:hypothetical protein